jgi:hypothetical protein
VCVWLVLVACVLPGSRFYDFSVRRRVG